MEFLIPYLHKKRQFLFYLTTFLLRNKIMHVKSPWSLYIYVHVCLEFFLFQFLNKQANFYENCKIILLENTLNHFFLITYNE